MNVLIVTTRDVSNTRSQGKATNNTASVGAIVAKADARFKWKNMHSMMRTSTAYIIRPAVL